MKKVFITQLILLFSIVAFSQATSKNGKTIKKISANVNKYGKASKQFILGKNGAYWDFTFNYKADSDKITGYFMDGKKPLSDTFSQKSLFIRYDDIADVMGFEERYDPRIILRRKNGSDFTLILNWKEKKVLKGQMNKKFKKLIKQNNKNKKKEILFIK